MTLARLGNIRSSKCLPSAGNVCDKHVLLTLGASTGPVLDGKFGHKNVLFRPAVSRKLGDLLTLHGAFGAVRTEVFFKRSESLKPAIVSTRLQHAEVRYVLVHVATTGQPQQAACCYHLPLPLLQRQ